MLENLRACILQISQFGCIVVFDRFPMRPYYNIKSSWCEEVLLEAATDDPTDGNTSIQIKIHCFVNSGSHHIFGHHIFLSSCPCVPGSRREKLESEMQSPEETFHLNSGPIRHCVILAGTAITISSGGQEGRCSPSAFFSSSF